MGRRVGGRQLRQPTGRKPRRAERHLWTHHTAPVASLGTRQSEEDLIKWPGGVGRALAGGVRGAT